MNELDFDAVARRTAASVSRRRSLIALGSAALGVSLLNPAVTTAKGGKGKDRCKSQVGKCRQGVADLCALFFQGSEITECEELLSPCCRFLENCEVAQAFECAIEKLEVKEM